MRALSCPATSPRAQSRQLLLAPVEEKDSRSEAPASGPPPKPRKKRPKPRCGPARRLSCCPSSSRQSAPTHAAARIPFRGRAGPDRLPRPRRTMPVKPRRAPLSSLNAAPECGSTSRPVRQDQRRRSAPGPPRRSPARRQPAIHPGPAADSPQQAHSAPGGQESGRPASRWSGGPASFSQPAPAQPTDSRDSQSKKKREAAVPSDFQQEVSHRQDVRRFAAPGAGARAAARQQARESAPF